MSSMAQGAIRKSRASRPPRTPDRSLPSPADGVSENSETLDLSFAHASTVFLRPTEEIRLMLVGCGGTGSWLAPALARITRALLDQGRRISLTFVDHDLIEEANTIRQNFSYADLGRHKARVLALRYAGAFGLEIGAHTEPFTPALVGRARGNYRPEDRLYVLFGCVDNAAARQQMHLAVEQIREESFGGYGSLRSHPRAWWIDAGNARASGQVLVGSATHVHELAHAFALDAFCCALPAPTLLHPELLTPLPEELEGSGLSCEELALRNAQSLMVNQHMAAIAGQMGLLLLTGELRRFATYLDLESGTMRSRSITRAEVAQALGKRPGFFKDAAT
jgi:PRTRC genetic system ThiF family protein